MIKTYRDKINQMSYRQRTGIYLLFTGISWVAARSIDDQPPEIMAAILVVVAFFGYKTLTNIYAMNVMEQLMKAEKTTEFIHKGKIYNIKTSKLILKVNHKYFYDRISEVEEYREYSILYKSEKGHYFLYIMERRYYKVNIEPLSEDQAKNWLLNYDAECYKQTFGEIEEA